MRAIGVRMLDELGRVVLPMEIRRALNLQKREKIEIYLSSEGIVLRKYLPACIFCGGTESVVSMQDKLICKHCHKDLISL